MSNTNNESTQVTEAISQQVQEATAQTIDKLTPEQEALMPVYVDKWIKIGTSTVNIPDDEAKEIVRDFRELISLKPDVPLVFAKNPMEAWVICCLWEQKVPLDKLQETMRAVFAGNRDYEIPTASLPFNDISLCSTFSFYDYMLNVVGVKLDDDLLRKYKVWERTSALWGTYPLEELTVVCRKPIEVHLNEDNQLHRDGGPALTFDGEGDFKLFVLNGVTVPEYLAVTPGHELDLNKYTDESNADVKAEFVRKAGIERFLTKGKLMDSYTNYNQEDHAWWWKSEYELWDMVCLFPSLNTAPYLKMLNQTVGVWHMEAVSPECDTLEKAIRERMGGRDMKIVRVA